MPSIKRTAKMVVFRSHDRTWGYRFMSSNGREKFRSSEQYSSNNLHRVWSDARALCLSIWNSRGTEGSFVAAGTPILFERRDELEGLNRPILFQPVVKFTMYDLVLLPKPR